MMATEIRSMNMPGIGDVHTVVCFDCGFSSAPTGRRDVAEKWLTVHRLSCVARPSF